MDTDYADNDQDSTAETLRSHALTFQGVLHSLMSNDKNFIFSKNYGS